MAFKVVGPEPMRGDIVTIDKPESSFHGMMGEVIGTLPSAVDGPTLFRVLLDPPPDGYEQGAHFTAAELVALGRRS